MTKGDWSAGHVFISHSSRDDAIVASIRKALLAYNVAVWDDARQLSAGDQLEPEIRRALDDARAVVAVLSPRTINSRWVTKGRPDLPVHWTALIRRLDTIVRGERDPSVAADPDLDYRDAVEVQLPLERLAPDQSA